MQVIGNVHVSQHIRFELALGIFDHRAHHHGPGRGIDRVRDEYNQAVEAFIAERRHVDLDMLPNPHGTRDLSGTSPTTQTEDRSAT